MAQTNILQIFVFSPLFTASPTGTGPIAFAGQGLGLVSE